ncbi:MAG: hypothetical protein AAF750_12140 [Planctomycetota bacterium]
MRRKDVIALVVALAVGIALVLPVLGGWKHDRRQAPNASQLRGIHQGMVMYGQNNKGYFPGLDSSGAVIQTRLSGQFAMMLDQNLFEPYFLISPNETHLKESVREGSGYVVTPANHSYAGLELNSSGGRLGAWSETLNTGEVVLGDRNTGTDANRNVQSVWTDPSQGWGGTIVWNDNSTSFETSHVIGTAYGQPVSKAGTATAPAGKHHVFPSDNLFEAVGPHDAWLVHD